MRIKICGITNFGDARAAVDLGADALGFVFAESSRRISPEEARSITSQLPPFVAKVGVFVNSPLTHLRRIRDYCGLDAVQLHGEEDADYIQALGPGVIKALRLNGKVFVGENGLLNNMQMRFKNEPARHKVLDLLGDLFLVGAPIKGQILAGRPGHKSNIEFARRLRKLYKQQQLTRKYQDVARKGVVFDFEAIQRILPHRYPFLLVDRITEFETGKRIVGLKNVTGNEEFFQGHFPGHPIMPGVLIIEAMAQTGGIMLLNDEENPEEKVVYFMAMDSVRFRKPVLPGAQLVFELEMLKRRSSSVKMQGKAYVDGEVVAEAEMMAAIVDRNQ